MATKKKTIQRKRQVAKVPDPAPLILTLRGQRVILDADLADLYGMSTKRFNEQCSRNKERFPEDFRFRLSTQCVVM